MKPHVRPEGAGPALRLPPCPVNSNVPSPVWPSNNCSRFTPDGPGRPSSDEVAIGTAGGTAIGTAGGFAAEAEAAEFPKDEPNAAPATLARPAAAPPGKAAAAAFAMPAPAVPPITALTAFPVVLGGAGCT